MVKKHIQIYISTIHRRRIRPADTQIDILRVFGIFCIVFAHCTSKGFQPFPLLTTSSNYVIQLFVFCTGWFYQDTTASACTYIKKTAKRYLLPYFLWNLIYGLICSGLKLLGVIQYGESLSFSTLFLAPWTHASQHVFNYAAWFLPDLFLVVVVTQLLRKLFQPAGFSADHILLTTLLFLSLGGILLSDQSCHYGFLAAVIRPLVMLPYLQFGYVFRTYWRPALTKRRSVSIMIFLLLIQVLINLCSGELMTKFVYGFFSGNPVFLLITAICAVVSTVLLAGLIAPLISGISLVRTVSRSTMSIMMHHLFIMFLIQLLFYCLSKVTVLPGYEADSFHKSIWYTYTFGLPEQPLRWGITIICLFFPTGGHLLYERIFLHLFSKTASAHQ